MKTPSVIGGGAVQVVGTGRFALRGMSLGGHPRRIRPDAKWRPLTTRDEATRLVERLIQRRFDGPSAPVPLDLTYYELQSTLGQLPLAETVDLHGRALFAASSLEPEVCMAVQRVCEVRARRHPPARQVRHRHGDSRP
ncbi:hypothetical protein JY651_05055 [Pyxidicoccus parkwayensis]|uniref:Uncharacterized protein n=1 Tax=Pyxidicoccus parkwayensis TaxID=2813578 RepID=A0ABX7P0U7_9BACT|nr:hypothetical protein [Pyxidicoccus parkwaysis]QSQ24336.1 hypothetical protein JY651_05055 [Pyxidicoccus parkwaysis]